MKHNLMLLANRTELILNLVKDLWKSQEIITIEQKVIGPGELLFHDFIIGG